MRHILGQDIILFKDNCYQFNPAIPYEYDVEAFESLVAKAASDPSPAKQISLYQKAINLVHGQYLQDIGIAWAWKEREKLNQTYLQASLALAELYLRSGHAPKALKICENTLNYDFTSEASYRLIMQIYKQMGDQGSIIQTYKTCKKVIAQIYSQPPSEETTELYNKLTSQTP